MTQTSHPNTDMAEPMETGRRLASASVMRSINMVLQVAVAFVMTPLLVTSLGERFYGFWTLVGTFLGYYGLLDLGIHSAVSRYVSRALGQGDADGVDATLSTSFFLFSSISLVSAIITLAAAASCRAIGSTPAEGRVLQWLVLILGARMTLSFPVRVFSGVLSAHLRHDLASCAAIVRLLAANVAIFWLLSHGHGILHIAWASFAAGLLEQALTVLFAYRTAPAMRIRRSKVHWEEIRSMFAYSWKTFLTEVGNLLRFKAGHFVVASVLGVTAVTYYGIATRLLQYFRETIFSVVGNLSPLFSRYEGQGRHDLVKSRFLLFSKLNVIAAMFVGISMMFYGRPFLMRWLGTQFNSSFTVVLILAIPYSLELMQMPTIGVLLGLSKHHYLTLFSLVQGPANVALSLLFARYWGLPGVAAAAACEMVAVKFIAQPVVACRAIGVSTWRYFVHVFGATTIKTVVPMLIYFSLVRTALRPQYGILIGLGLGQCAVVLPLAFYTALSCDERTLVLQSLLKRREGPRASDLSATRDDAGESVSECRR